MGGVCECVFLLGERGRGGGGVVDFFSATSIGVGKFVRTMPFARSFLHTYNH